MATLSGTNVGAYKGALVRVYNRGTGALVGATLSDASTGAWSMTVPAGQKYVAYCFDAAGDPYAQYLGFTSSFNGANGATPSTDDTGKTLTWGGGLALSNAQSKTGDTSVGPISGTKYVRFPATGFEYGTTPTLTLSAHIYPTATPSKGAIFGGSSRPAYNAWTFGVHGQSSWLEASNLGEEYGTGTYLNINAWNEFKACIQAGVARFFINGNLVQTRDNAGWGSSIWTGIGNVVIGNSYISAANSNPFIGYIDAVEIHNNLCKYTASYTPITPVVVGYPPSAVENAQIYDDLTPV